MRYGSGRGRRAGVGDGRAGHPALNNAEIERILDTAAAIGVKGAGHCCCACRSKCATSSVNG